MICKTQSQLPPHALIPANDLEREIWDDVYLTVPKFESFDNSDAASSRSAFDSRAALPFSPKARPATFHNWTNLFAKAVDFAAFAIVLAMLWALIEMLAGVRS